jgi:molybdenum transport protein
MGWLTEMFFVPDSFIDSLVGEDLHILDLTTEAMEIGGLGGTVSCFPKQECVVAGIEEAARAFERFGCRVETMARSGDRLEAGTVFLKALGTAGQLHAVYKTAQNIMEYSSGIATRCAEALRQARAVSPHVELAVTRKHFPGAKILSLKAALAGGAALHRLGLSDSILVFDHHRVFTDAFIPLLKKMAVRFPEKKIAEEAGSMEEALAFAEAGADIVQCERFACSDLAALVARLRKEKPGVKILAAGGINADNAREYASTGVDVLVTSWVYFGKPEDIKMKFSSGGE